CARSGSAIAVAFDYW
nr:immunoglobulin heavy chain junction region [Macaca mulatta]MOV54169.1 immunoglobulin heavy chain junction region [Macaca mulatta]MOV54548.1 immunoglobulin heavy chain junction region [Macaca mulatta]MOV54669.1 immunoglobulin heavy chain junction region [Macaca mulatta]MOV54756.1 immunoglobulin heavy chain junction region [Macaca mulatta]